MQIRFNPAVSRNMGYKNNLRQAIIVASPHPSHLSGTILNRSFGRVPQGREEVVRKSAKNNPSFGEFRADWYCRLIENPESVDQLWGAVAVSEKYRQTSGKGEIKPFHISALDAVDTLELAAPVFEDPYMEAYYLGVQDIISQAYGVTAFAKADYEAPIN